MGPLSASLSWDALFPQREANWPRCGLSNYTPGWGQRSWTHAQSGFLAAVKSKTLSSFVQFEVSVLSICVWVEFCPFTFGLNTLKKDFSSQFSENIGDLCNMDNTWQQGYVCFTPETLRCSAIIYGVFFKSHLTNCLCRDSCCTKKPQGTPTWNLTTARLSPLPTWTALRGASQSSN